MYQYLIVFFFTNAKVEITASDPREYLFRGCPNYGGYIVDTRVELFDIFFSYGYHD